MDSLLVLGLVPGTDIQITFLGWLYVGLGFGALLGLLYIKRRHIIMFFLLSRKLKRQLEQIEPQQLTLTF
jgi:uncharacterized membrane protein YciS (DUF1049 family)